MTNEDIKQKIAERHAISEAALAKGPLFLTIDLSKDNRTLFELVQNPVNWKEPTAPAVVKTRDEANRLMEAINFFAGGSGLFWRGHHRGFLVTSRGYYHYVGA